MSVFKNSALATVYGPELACRGFLINRGRQGVEAYDPECRSIGLFDDADKAAAAVHHHAEMRP
jgi:hypothetical protein